MIFFVAISALSSLSRFAADPYFDSFKIDHFEKKNEILRESIGSLNAQLKEYETVLTELQNRDDKLYRSVLALEPLSPSIRNAGFGGSEGTSLQVNSYGDELVLQTFKKIEQLNLKTRVQSESLRDVFDLAMEQQKLLAHKPSIQPISPACFFFLSSGFGVRRDPFTRLRRMHTGIDLAGEQGVPIYASGDGVVVEAEYNKTGYGKQVLVNHGFGYLSRYAHLSNINVKPGQKVKRGQIVGELGNTGRSTGPHLHYEVIFRGKHVNPLHYFFENLTPSEFELITSRSGN